MERSVAWSLKRRLTVIVSISLLPALLIAVFQVLSIRDDQMTNRERVVRAQVEAQVGVLTRFYALESQGELDRAEAQRQAAEVLRTVRYGDDDYFWIQDRDLQLVMHPTSALEGSNVSEVEDPNGLRLFEAFERVVAVEGAGFVGYEWPKPGSEVPEPKVSYVAGFEPWGWVIGTGIYIDDVDRAVRTEALRLTSVILLAIAIAGGISGFMVRRIRTTLQQGTASLDVASDELTEVSGHVGAASRATAEEAQVVAAAGQQVGHNVQTVATAVEEMSASVREIAGAASEASRVASDAVSTAESTTGSVEQLGRSSEGIGEVIDVITTIAEQTNLLALNATIEAARAGEAGKGFAVVANEVKELANQTAKATNDIRSRIDAIRSDADTAVASIAEIGGVIESIAAMQTTIASAVEEQTATTNEIARNIHEAALGATQIAERIGAVAGAAEETSLGVVRTEQTAEQVRRVAVELRTLVNGGSKESSTARPRLRGSDGAAMPTTTEQVPHPPRSKRYRALQS